MNDQGNEEAKRGLRTEISDISKMGASVGLVIGGGNIVRGVQLSKMGMERAGADYMGMLGTVINALALQDVLEKADLETRVMTAIAMESIAEPFIRRRAMRHCILACGRDRDTSRAPPRPGRC